MLTGAGTAFCSGVDLSEFHRDGPPPRRYARDHSSWFETQEWVARHPAVIIAAVNGYALGGGLTLVHNADLAIASDRAEFGMPEFGFGSFPGLAGATTLKRLLPKHAAQMILTALRVDASTAWRFGIVNEVVPAERLLERAEELASHVAQFDAVLLDHAEKAIREIPNFDWTRAIEYSTTYISQAVALQTQERGERLGRFLSWAAWGRSGRQVAGVRLDDAALMQCSQILAAET